MASGCQAQVAIKGAQDVYLISPCDVTFWKTTYARHTNFAVGEIEMQFNNACGCGRQKFSCKISRSGDLLHSTYVAMTLPRIVYPHTTNPVDWNPVVDPMLHPGVHYYDIANGQYVSWVNAIGHAMLQEVSVNIGSHEFDSHLGEFLEMWESLSAPSDRLLSQMTGRYASIEACAEASLMDQTLFVPLRFWFNRFTEQALPLVSLYWHDTELQFATRPISDLYVVNGSVIAGSVVEGPATNSATQISVPNVIPDMHILSNLVYLDRPERAAFANSKSEYVIDQVQFLGAESITSTATTLSHSIRFNHPITEIIWAIRRNEAEAANDWFNFWGAMTTELPDNQLTDPFATASITLNNHDRVIDLPAMYFRTVQPYQSHSRIPAADRCVYCYSFALEPEEMFDSGSVNMSRMDSGYLKITYNNNDGLHPSINGRIYIFGRGKNVAKVTVGMAGLKFAA